VRVVKKRTGRAGPAPTSEELAPPAGPERVRCARGSKAHRPRRPGTNERGTRSSCRAGASPLCAWFKEAHRPRRPGTNERGTRPSCRAGASPLCAWFKKAHRPRRPGTNERGTHSSCRAEASPLCAWLKKRTGRAGPAPTSEELAPPAGPERVRCARGSKSAQAAQARHQRARNSLLLPGRSESVVRVVKKAHRPERVRCARVP
jgi:hypothetical protein